MAAPTHLVDNSVIARAHKPPVAATFEPKVLAGLIASCSITDLEHLFSARSGEEHRARRADIALPFASSYKTFLTSTGIIAFWALALLGLSYYARTKIGAQRWRRLHRFAALAWVLGIVHSLGEGTDAGQAWFLAMTALVVLPALTLLAARWLTASRKPAAPRARAFARTE